MCKARLIMALLALVIGLFVSALVLTSSAAQDDVRYHQRYMNASGGFVLVVETHVFAELSGLAGATHVLIVLDETAKYLEAHGALLVDVARIVDGKIGVPTRYRIAAVDADTAAGWTNIWLVQHG